MVQLQEGHPTFQSAAGKAGEDPDCETIAGRRDLGTVQMILESNERGDSGATIFDQVNYGLYVNFTVTAANSQTPTYVILGEPMT